MPCPHVQYKSHYHQINHHDCGTLFCRHCPDLDTLPADCPGACEPALRFFAACPIRDACPCYLGTNPHRRSMFHKWLNQRHTESLQRAMISANRTSDKR